MTGGIRAQLNAPPGTAGAGDTTPGPLAHRLVGTPRPLPPSSRHLFLHPTASGTGPCSLPFSSALRISSPRPAPVYTGKTRSGFIAAFLKKQQQTPNQPRLLAVPSSSPSSEGDGRFQRRGGAAGLRARRAYVMGLCPARPLHALGTRGAPAASPAPQPRAPASILARPGRLLSSFRLPSILKIYFFL